MFICRFKILESSKTNVYPRHSDVPQYVTDQYNDQTVSNVDILHKSMAGLRRFLTFSKFELLTKISQLVSKIKEKNCNLNKMRF